MLGFPSVVKLNILLQAYLSLCVLD